MSTQPSAEGHSGPHTEVGVSGPREKSRLCRRSLLLDLIKGVESTQMQLELQAGHLFQLRASLLPGQSQRKY